jgi:uncharacterized protein YciI
MNFKPQFKTDLLCASSIKKHLGIFIIQILSDRKHMKLFASVMLFIVFSCVPVLSQELTMDSVMQKVSKGKPFILVILKTGKPLPADQGLVQKLQSDHLLHLFQLEKDRKISVFGPVTNDTSSVRGIIIFNSPDSAAARTELERDPYISQGYLRYDLYNWFTIPGQQIPK